MKEKVVPNNSPVMLKKKEVECHYRISSFSNKIKFLTACNDSLKSNTLNAKVVYVTCDKCVFNFNYDACVSKFIINVNARTKKPKLVPISTRKPTKNANQFVATPHKKSVASETNIQKSKSHFRMLYEKTNSRCTKHMTGNLKLLCDFVEKYLGTVRFRNDQFAPILGYGDLVQGNVTIKMVYYAEGLNHNLFSISQFCDADLETSVHNSTKLRIPDYNNEPSSLKLVLNVVPTSFDLSDNLQQKDTQPTLNVQPTLELIIPPIDVNAKENNTDEAEDEEFEAYEFINPLLHQE
ncbi:hypothetical protein Tco_1175780 [Tanacetum coccineum]